MKTIQTVPHYSDDELKKIMLSQNLVRAYRDWQIIYLVQTNKNKTAKEIALFLGIKITKIYTIVQGYNKHGKKFRTYDNWGGRREQRCLFTIEEEASILKELEQDAMQGKILTYHHVKSFIEKKKGERISDDYVWDLFKRHGWKKKVPRKHHPLRNEEKQEEAKKNSKRIWQPNH